MRTVRILLALVVLLLIGSSVVYRTSHLARAQTAQSRLTPCCAELNGTAPREIDFPYYSLRDGFSATLFLVSDSPKPMDLTVAVRSLMGETVLTPMSIQPQEKLPVDLKQLLTDLGADVNGSFAEGSVSVYFMGTIMPLAGQLTMTNPALSLIHESEMVQNDPGHSDLPPVLNGLWWNIGGGRDARIMVSNTSGSPVTADVFLDFQGQRHPSAPLTFLANETKVLSITKLLGELNTAQPQAPEGGITILTRGPNPTLIAQGKILDPATGFSTSLNFPLPQVQRSSALHASGVAIGTPTQDSPFARTGTFIPHVIVRNLQGSPQTVTITVEYPGKEGPEQTALAPLPLDPYSTKDFSLYSVMDQLPLPLPFCSIRIQYSGAPGSAIAEVSSVETQKDLVIDSRLANEGDGWAGSGANPWHLDEETESILFLTDMGDKPARIGFQVQAHGVHYYLTDLKLSPHETRAIDLRKLRDAQKLDFRKSRIPADASDGSVLWIRLDNVPVMGRLVVLQRHKGMASNYNCSFCCCPPDFTSVGTTPVTVTGIPGDTVQFTCTEHKTDCNGADFPSDITGAATWTSSNAAVATVNTTGLSTAVGGGSANIIAAFTDDIWLSSIDCGFCSAQPVTLRGSATCDVRIPSSLSVVSSSVIPMSWCNFPESAYGIAIAIRYQVWDNTGARLARSDMEPQERLVNLVLNGTPMGDEHPNWGDVGPTAYPGTSRFTDSNGQFVDAPFAFCSSVGFVASDTQYISVVKGVARYPVRTNNWSYASSVGGHGSVTNGIGGDISQSR